MSQNTTKTHDTRQFKPITCQECDHLPIIVGGKPPTGAIGVYLTCGCEDIGLMEISVSVPKKEWPARWVLPEPDRKLKSWNLVEGFDYGR